jgi:hypothetical protein
VLNPVAGGAFWMKRKKAVKHVARGRAQWRGEAIEFIKDNMLTHVAPHHVHKFTSGDGYATVAAIRRIPVLMPIRLITGKRAARSPRDGDDRIVELSRTPAPHYVPRHVPELDISMVKMRCESPAWLSIF